jgi:hypothetical protein
MEAIGVPTLLCGGDWQRSATNSFMSAAQRNK